MAAGADTPHRKERSHLRALSGRPVSRRPLDRHPRQRHPRQGCQGRGASLPRLYPVAGRRLVGTAGARRRQPEQADLRSRHRPPGRLHSIGRGNDLYAQRFEAGPSLRPRQDRLGRGFGQGGLGRRQSPPHADPRRRPRRHRRLLSRRFRRGDQCVAGRGLSRRADRLDRQSGGIQLPRRRRHRDFRPLDPADQARSA